MSYFRYFYLFFFQNILFYGDVRSDVDMATTFECQNEVREICVDSATNRCQFERHPTANMVEKAEWRRERRGQRGRNQNVS